MSFISPDRNQKNLIGYFIDDFVSKDNKSHFVVNLVSQLDLSALYERYSSQGNDAIDPQIILAVWFFAYSESISSTRRLEEKCNYDLRFIYVSANLHPDHTTLSRFRKKHADLMADYFVQIVLLARKSGLFDFKEINIDGTKIKSSCSKKQSFKEDQLCKMIESLRKDIADYMERCALKEAMDETYEDIDLDELHEKIDKLKQQEKRLLQRQKQIQERKKELKAEHRANHQINIIEPEARLMSQGDGPCYNAQAAAASNSHFIVSNDVVTDTNDQRQFSRMHQKTEENIGKDSDRQYNSDAGYHSLAQLDYIEEKEVDAVIADPTPANRSSKSAPTKMEILLDKGRELRRSDFAYNAEDDYYLCPAGQELKPSSKKSSSKSKVKTYRASGCQDCLLRNACLSKKQKKGSRKINRDYREVLAEKMKAKLETEEAKSRLQTRAFTIEPVFGNIKHNLRFNRFSLRGLDQVKAEFNMMCIAHNMNIIFGLVKKGCFSFLLLLNYLGYYYDLTISKIRFIIASRLASNTR